MTNKMIIGAIAEDLYRAANGLHTGTTKMAEIFIKESLKRKEEVDANSVKPYIRTCLDSLITICGQEDVQKKAEDLLMQSVILRNYAQNL